MITTDIHAMHSTGSKQPQLVVAHRNDLVAQLSQRLHDAGVPHTAIDARWFLEQGIHQETAFRNIIGKAGELGHILVINMQGARGVDIPLTAASRTAGGLHVRVTAHSGLSDDVDIQAENRAARSGDPGNVTYYISPDDDVFRLSHNNDVHFAVIKYTDALTIHNDAIGTGNTEQIREAREALAETEQGLRDHVSGIQIEAATRFRQTVQTGYQANAPPQDLTGLRSDNPNTPTSHPPPPSPDPTELLNPTRELEELPAPLWELDDALVGSREVALPAKGWSRHDDTFVQDAGVLLRHEAGGWRLAATSQAGWSSTRGSASLLRRRPDGQFVLQSVVSQDGSIPPPDTVIGRALLAAEPAAVQVLADGESPLWIRFGPGTERVAEPAEWARHQLLLRLPGVLLREADPLVCQVAAMAQRARTVTAAEAGLDEMMPRIRATRVGLPGGALTQLVSGGRAGLVQALLQVVLGDSPEPRAWEEMYGALAGMLSVVVHGPLLADRAQLELIRLVDRLRDLLLSGQVDPRASFVNRLIGFIEVRVPIGLIGFEERRLFAPAAFDANIGPATRSMLGRIALSDIEGGLVASIPPLQLGAIDALWRVLELGFFRVKALVQAWGGSIENEWATLWTEFVDLSARIRLGAWVPLTRVRSLRSTCGMRWRACMGA